MRMVSLLLVGGACLSACTQSSPPSSPGGRISIPFEGSFDAQSGRLTFKHGIEGEGSSALSTLPYGTGANQVYFHTLQPTVAWNAPDLVGDVTAVNGTGNPVQAFTAVIDNIVGTGVTWNGPFNYGTVPAMSSSIATTWSFNNPGAVNFTFVGHAEGHISLGLVGYWPFEEGAGTSTADVSPFGNHGTLDGIGLPTWTAGRVGGGLQFSSNAYESIVTVNDAPSLNPTVEVSISAWATLDSETSPDGLEVIALKTTDINWNDGFGLYRRDGVGVCGFVNLWDAFVACAPFAATATPRHIAYTYNGAVLKLFVDGVMVASNDFFLDITTTTSMLNIGMQYGLGYGWPGMIDEVRVYDRALSDAEVLALHDNP